MLDKLIANILAGYLGRYIDDLNENNVRIRLWQGSITLENLRFKTTALLGLELPIGVKEGQIGFLNVTIPWNRLRSEPIKIELSDIVIILQPKTMGTYNEKEELEHQYRRKKEQLAIIELIRKKRENVTVSEGESYTNVDGGGVRSGLAWFDETQFKNDKNERDENGKRQKSPQRSLNSTSTAENASEDQNFIEKLKATILNNIQISIKNVFIVYEDTVADSWRTSYFTMKCESFFVQTCDVHWIAKFISKGGDVFLHKLLQLKGLSVDAFQLEGIGVSRRDKKAFAQAGCLSSEITCQGVLEGVLDVLQNQSLFSEMNACDAIHHENIKGGKIFIPTPAVEETVKQHQEGDERRKQQKLSLVSPFDFYIKIRYQPIIKNVQVPKWTCFAVLDKILINFNRSKWNCIRRSIQYWERYDDFKAFLKFRPCGKGSTPLTDPKAWWKFAIKSVMHKVHKERVARGFFDWNQYVMTKQQQREYIELYKRAMNPEWLLPLTPPDAHRIKELEMALSIESLKAARSLAYAKLTIEKEQWLAKVTYTENLNKKVTERAVHRMRKNEKDTTNNNIIINNTNKNSNENNDSKKHGWWGWIVGRKSGVGERPREILDVYATAEDDKMRCEQEKDNRDEADTDVTNNKDKDTNVGNRTNSGGYNNDDTHTHFSMRKIDKESSKDVTKLSDKEEQQLKNLMYAERWTAEHRRILAAEFELDWNENNNTIGGMTSTASSEIGKSENTLSPSPTHSLNSDEPQNTFSEVESPHNCRSAEHTHRPVKSNFFAPPSSDHELEKLHMSFLLRDCNIKFANEHLHPFALVKIQNADLIYKTTTTTFAIFATVKSLLVLDLTCKEKKRIREQTRKGDNTLSSSLLSSLASQDVILSAAKDPCSATLTHCSVGNDMGSTQNFILKTQPLRANDDCKKKGLPSFLSSSSQSMLQFKFSKLDKQMNDGLQYRFNFKLAPMDLFISVPWIQSCVDFWCKRPQFFPSPQDIFFSRESKTSTNTVSGEENGRVGKLPLSFASNSYESNNRPSKSIPLFVQLLTKVEKQQVFDIYGNVRGLNIVVIHNSDTTNRNNDAIFAAFDQKRKHNERKDETSICLSENKKLEYQQQLLCPLQQKCCLFVSQISIYNDSSSQCKRQAYLTQMKRQLQASIIADDNSNNKDSLYSVFPLGVDAKNYVDTFHVLVKDAQIICEYFEDDSHHGVSCGIADSNEMMMVQNQQQKLKINNAMKDMKKNYKYSYHLQQHVIMPKSTFGFECQYSLVKQNANIPLFSVNLTSDSSLTLVAPRKTWVVMVDTLTSLRELRGSFFLSNFQEYSLQQHVDEKGENPCDTTTGGQNDLNLNIAPEGSKFIASRAIGPRQLFITEHDNDVAAIAPQNALCYAMANCPIIVENGALTAYHLEQPSVPLVKVELKRGCFTLVPLDLLSEKEQIEDERANDEKELLNYEKYVCLIKEGFDGVNIHNNNNIDDDDDLQEEGDSFFDFSSKLSGNFGVTLYIHAGGCDHSSRKGLRAAKRLFKKFNIPIYRTLFQQKEAFEFVFSILKNTGLSEREKKDLLDSYNKIRLSFHTNPCNALSFYFKTALLRDLFMEKVRECGSSSGNTGMFTMGQKECSFIGTQEHQQQSQETSPTQEASENTVDGLKAKVILQQQRRLQFKAIFPSFRIGIMEVSDDKGKAQKLSADENISTASTLKVALLDSTEAFCISYYSTPSNQSYTNIRTGEWGVYTALNVIKAGRNEFSTGNNTVFLNNNNIINNSECSCDNHHHINEATDIFNVKKQLLRLKKDILISYNFFESELNNNDNSNSNNEKRNFITCVPVLVIAKREETQQDACGGKHDKKSGMTGEAGGLNVFMHTFGNNSDLHSNIKSNGDNENTTTNRNNLSRHCPEITVKTEENMNLVVNNDLLNSLELLWDWFGIVSMKKFAFNVIYAKGFSSKICDLLTEWENISTSLVDNKSGNNYNNNNNINFINIINNSSSDTSFFSGSYSPRIPTVSSLPIPRSFVDTVPASDIFHQFSLRFWVNIRINMFSKITMEVFHDRSALFLSALDDKDRKDVESNFPLHAIDEQPVMRIHATGLVGNFVGCAGFQQTKIELHNPNIYLCKWSKEEKTDCANKWAFQQSSSNGKHLHTNREENDYFHHHWESIMSPKRRLVVHPHSGGNSSKGLLSLQPMSDHYQHQPCVLICQFVSISKPSYLPLHEWMLLTPGESSLSFQPRGVFLCLSPSHGLMNKRSDFALSSRQQLVIDSSRLNTSGIFYTTYLTVVAQNATSNYSQSSLWSVTELTRNGLFLRLYALFQRPVVVRSTILTQLNWSWLYFYQNLQDKRDGMPIISNFIPGWQIAKNLNMDDWNLCDPPRFNYAIMQVAAELRNIDLAFAHEGEVAASVLASMGSVTLYNEISENKYSGFNLSTTKDECGKDDTKKKEKKGVIFNIPGFSTSAHDLVIKFENMRIWVDTQPHLSFLPDQMSTIQGLFNKRKQKDSSCGINTTVAEVQENNIGHNCSTRYQQRQKEHSVIDDVINIENRTLPSGKVLAAIIAQFPSEYSTSLLLKTSLGLCLQKEKNISADCFGFLDVEHSNLCDTGLYYHSMKNVYLLRSDSKCREPICKFTEVLSGLNLTYKATWEMFNPHKKGPEFSIQIKATNACVLSCSTLQCAALNDTLCRCFLSPFHSLYPVRRQQLKPFITWRQWLQYVLMGSNKTTTNNNHNNNDKYVITKQHTQAMSTINAISTCNEANDDQVYDLSSRLPEGLNKTYCHQQFLNAKPSAAEKKILTPTEYAVVCSEFSIMLEDRICLRLTNPEIAFSPIISQEVIKKGDLEDLNDFFGKMERMPKATAANDSKANNNNNDSDNTNNNNLSLLLQGLRNATDVALELSGPSHLKVQWFSDGASRQRVVTKEIEIWDLYDFSEDIDKKANINLEKESSNSIKQVNTSLSLSCLRFISLKEIIPDGRRLLFVGPTTAEKHSHERASSAALNVDNQKNEDIQEGWTINPTPFLKDFNQDYQMDEDDDFSHFGLRCYFGCVASPESFSLESNINSKNNDINSLSYTIIFINSVELDFVPISYFTLRDTFASMVMINSVAKLFKRPIQSLGVNGSALTKTHHPEPSVSSTTVGITTDNNGNLSSCSARSLGVLRTFQQDFSLSSMTVTIPEKPWLRDSEPLFFVNFKGFDFTQNSSHIGSDEESNNISAWLETIGSNGVFFRKERELSNCGVGTENKKGKSYYNVFPIFVPRNEFNESQQQHPEKVDNDANGNKCENDLEKFFSVRKTTTKSQKKNSVRKKCLATFSLNDKEGLNMNVGYVWIFSPFKEKIKSIYTALSHSCVTKCQELKYSLEERVIMRLMKAPLLSSQHTLFLPTLTTTSLPSFFSLVGGIQDVKIVVKNPCIILLEHNSFSHLSNDRTGAIVNLGLIEYEQKKCLDDPHSLKQLLHIICANVSSLQLQNHYYLHPVNITCSSKITIDTAVADNERLCYKKNSGKFKNNNSNVITNNIEKDNTNQSTGTTRLRDCMADFFDSDKQKAKKDLTLNEITFLKNACNDNSITTTTESQHNLFIESSFLSNSSSSDRFIRAPIAETREVIVKLDGFVIDVGPCEYEIALKSLYRHLLASDGAEDDKTEDDDVIEKKVHDITQQASESGDERRGGVPEKEDNDQNCQAVDYEYEVDGLIDGDYWHKKLQLKDMLASKRKRESDQNPLLNPYFSLSKAESDLHSQHVSENKNNVMNIPVCNLKINILWDSFKLRLYRPDCAILLDIDRINLVYEGLTPLSTDDILRKQLGLFYTNISNKMEKTMEFVPDPAKSRVHFCGCTSASKLTVPAGYAAVLEMQRGNKEAMKEHSLTSTKNSSTFFSHENKNKSGENTTTLDKLFNIPKTTNTFDSKEDVAGEDDGHYDRDFCNEISHKNIFIIPLSEKMTKIVCESFKCGLEGKPPLIEATAVVNKKMDSNHPPKKEDASSPTSITPFASALHKNDYQGNGQAVEPDLGNNIGVLTQTDDYNCWFTVNIGKCKTVLDIADLERMMRFLYEPYRRVTSFSSCTAAGKRQKQKPQSVLHVVEISDNFFFSGRALLGLHLILKFKNTKYNRITVNCDSNDVFFLSNGLFPVVEVDPGMTVIFRNGRIHLNNKKIENFVSAGEASYVTIERKSCIFVEAKRTRRELRRILKKNGSLLSRFAEWVMAEKEEESLSDKEELLEGQRDKNNLFLPYSKKDNRGDLEIQSSLSPTAGSKTIEDYSYLKYPYYGHIKPLQQMQRVFLLKGHMELLLPEKNSFLFTSTNSSEKNNTTRAISVSSAIEIEVNSRIVPGLVFISEDDITNTVISTINNSARKDKNGSGNGLENYLSSFTSQKVKKNSTIMEKSEKILQKQPSALFFLSSSSNKALRKKPHHIIINETFKTTLIHFTSLEAECQYFSNRQRCSTTATPFSLTPTNRAPIITPWSMQLYIDSSVSLKNGLTRAGDGVTIRRGPFFLALPENCNDINTPDRGEFAYLTKVKRTVDVVATQAIDIRIRSGDIKVIERAVNNVKKIIDSIGGKIESDTNSENSGMTNGNSLMSLPTETKSVAFRYITVAQRSLRRTHVGTTAYLQLSLPRIVIFFLDDILSVSSDFPLLQLTFSDLQAPKVELGGWSDVQFSIMASLNYYNQYEGKWQPLWEAMQIDGKVVWGQKEHERQILTASTTTETKARVRIGDVRLHITPIFAELLAHINALMAQFTAFNSLSQHDHHIKTCHLTGGNNHHSVITSNPSAVPNISSDAYDNKFHSYVLSQQLGVPLSVEFAQDTEGRFPRNRVLRSLENMSFSFPRINGRDLHPSQQCVVIRTPTATQSSIVCISAVGTSHVRLPHGPHVEEHLVSETVVKNGCKYVVIRTPITFINNLGFRMILSGVGVVSPHGGTLSVGIDGLRKRCVFFPELEEKELSCRAVSLGVIYAMLGNFYDQRFLCVSPVDVRSTVIAGGSSLSSSNRSREDNDDRAVFFCVCFSPLKPIPGCQLPDVQATFEASFYVVNSTNQKLAITLLHYPPRQLYDQSRRQPGVTANSPLSKRRRLQNAVTFILEAEGVYPVTEVNVLEEVYLKVIINYPFGEQLVSVGDSGFRIDTAMMIQLQSGKEKKSAIVLKDSYGMEFTLCMTYYNNRVILHCPYWILNQTTNYLQFTTICEGIIRNANKSTSGRRSVPLCAGLGSEGLPPSIFTPFLLNSPQLMSESESDTISSQLYLRVGVYNKQGDLEWSPWSSALTINTLINMAIVECGGGKERMTLTYSVELAGTKSSEGAAVIDTRVIKITPRWIVVNRCPRPFFMRQSEEVSVTYEVMPNASKVIESCFKGQKGNTSDNRVGIAEQRKSATTAKYYNTLHFRHSESTGGFRRRVNEKNLTMHNKGNAITRDHHQDPEELREDYANIVVSSTWTPSVNIDKMGDEMLNLRYAIKTPDGQLRCESYVVHITTYVKGSVMMVSVDEPERAPYLVENRTNYMIFAKQLNVGLQLSVYPRTTGDFTWDDPRMPQILQLWAAEGTKSTEPVELHLSPQQVAQNGYKDTMAGLVLMDTIEPGSIIPLFVRVRVDRGNYYVISITDDNVIESLQRVPFPCFTYDVKIESVCALVADINRDVLLVTVGADSGGITGSFTQGYVRNQQREQQSLPHLYLTSSAASSSSTGSQQSCENDTNDINELRVSIGVVQVQTRQALSKKSSRELVIFSTMQGRMSSVYICRKLQRVMPVILSPLIDIVVQPIKITVTESFMTKLLKLYEIFVNAFSFSALSSTAATNSELLNDLHRIAWQMEVIAPSHEFVKDQFQNRIVFINKLAVSPINISFSLERDSEEESFFREKLGFLSLFIRNIKDIRFNWRRINKCNVYDKMWLLSTFLINYYQAEFKRQLLGTLHLVGVGAVKGFVSDLLEEYFFSPIIDTNKRNKSFFDISPVAVSFKEATYDASTITGLNYESIMDNNNSNVLHIEERELDAGISLPSLSTENDSSNELNRRMLSVRQKTLFTLAMSLTWHEFCNQVTPEEFCIYSHIAVRHFLRTRDLKVPASLSTCRRCKEIEKMREERLVKGEQPMLSFFNSFSSSSSHTEAITQTAMNPGTNRIRANTTPPPIPTSSSTLHLQWDEFAHHCTWTEFISFCNIPQVMEHKDELKNAIAGMTFNVVRLNENKSNTTGGWGS